MTWFRAYRFTIILVLLSCGLQAQQNDDASYNDTATITLIPAPQDDEEELEEVTINSGEDLSRFVIPKDVYRNFKDPREWRKISPDSQRSFEKDPAFWYANYPFNGKKDETANNRVIKSKWVFTLLWIIILAAFVGILAWFLSQNGIGFFKNDTRLDKGSEYEDLEEEDIFSLNYTQKIEKAEQDGNYRLAIRYLFLRLLKILSEKGAIQYKPDRTNLDYLMQLHGKPEFKGFFEGARHYEYTWYGKFIPEQEAYSAVRQFFEGLQKKGGVV